MSEASFLVRDPWAMRMRNSLWAYVAAYVDAYVAKKQPKLMI